mgnify:CR=1 FL=1
MLDHRATLIQDIYDYLKILTGHVRCQMQEHHYLCGTTEEDVVKWIIAEELFLIHGLITRGHLQNKIPHADIHSRIEHTLPTSLSALTSIFVRAPRLFEPETEIDLLIIGRDLYISYVAQDATFRSPPLK